MFSCNKPCNACLHKHSTNLAHEPTEQTTPALHVWSEMPFKGQLFISRCEIKSGIHEPRIGNAVPAGDAGECDTPAKVRLNNEMCHFVPCSPTATESSFGSSRPVLVGACERRCTFGRLYSKNRQKPTAKNANCLTKLVQNDILGLMAMCAQISLQIRSNPLAEDTARWLICTEQPSTTSKHKSFLPHGTAVKVCLQASVRRVVS